MTIQVDEQFREMLPEELKELGNALIDAIRERWDGELKFFPSEKMFVETPLNFFTLTIRSRKKLIAVTVYRKPERYADMTHPFTLGVCRTNYSWFEVADVSEIGDAMRLLERAHELALQKRVVKATPRKTLVG